jgi:cell division protein FtsB
MKAVKYLFALWVGVLIYTLMSFFFGETGVSAYRQLQNEAKKQEANIRDLKLLNAELENTMNSLLYDKDTLLLYAREQGYATAQERFVRIVGLGGSQKPVYSAGEAVIAAEPQFISDKIIRIISFCTAISLLICMAVFDFMKFLGDQ